MKNILNLFKKWLKACNPETKAEDLCKLLEEKNSWIIREIASNPNTPPNILAKLCADYPDRVQKNPSLPLIFLENPNFLEKIYCDSFDPLKNDIDSNKIKAKPLPDFFINRGLDHELPEIRALIADNIFTSPKILSELSNDSNLAVRLRVAQNLQTPISDLNKLAKDSKQEIRLALANNFKTPQSILLQLARDRNYLVRACVAKNVNTPPEALVFLAEDLRKEVKLGLASNRKCPLKVLEFLSYDSDELIRLSSRSNPKLRVIQSIFGR